MLIDVHAHFYHDRTPRADWRERNASRLRAGERMGVTIHVASVLGTWGRTSPVYFPSPPDLQYGNDADRKSTRLNSSHLVISYAVFCLKKKKKKVKKHEKELSDKVARDRGNGEVERIRDR